MKTKFAALMVVCGIVVVPTYASAQACAGGIVVAALIINATQNRELTANEAMTCGLILDTSKPAKPARAPGAKSAKKKVG